jgi:hypothetical protein
MFMERKASVEAQIEELKITMVLINHKCWYYKTAIDAGTEDIHKEDKIGFLLVSNRKLPVNVSTNLRNHIFLTFTLLIPQYPLMITLFSMKLPICLRK